MECELAWWEYHQSVSLTRNTFALGEIIKTDSYQLSSFTREAGLILKSWCQMSGLGCPLMSLWSAACVSVSAANALTKNQPAFRLQSLQLISDLSSDFPCNLKVKQYKSIKLADVAYIYNQSVCFKLFWTTLFLH